ncbi:hypothetical protein CSUB01_08684 [Colletotrichum sublineola]|uniref:F-box domain-containing protein n=1 Tax=Colletotrichum sublineola TaxID=1173701 RepID=A0A066X7A3_COLSU|nr:hypothetical protein CSUB01_08684 [Colletotrichum sublineola]
MEHYSLQTRTMLACQKELCRTSVGYLGASTSLLSHFFFTTTPQITYREDTIAAPKPTIINRPDLASQVKTLLLVETDEISGCTPDLAQLLRKTTKRLGALENAPTQEYLPTKIWQGFSGQPQTLTRIQRRRIHHWLEELAILLSPNLEWLFIARDSLVDYEHISDSGASFPALKTISITGVSKNQHVHEASVLFKAAPNLESLYSLQCNLFEGIGSWTMGKPWNLKLQTVRRLVLNDIGLKDLDLLVNCCPSLQQLEVFATKIHLTSGIGYWNVAKLMQALKSAQHTLRKLRLSSSSTQKHAVDSQLNAGGISWSFRQFDQLEELSLDQTVIESLSRDTSIEDSTAPDWSLIGILPSSVCKVELLQMRRGFTESLRRLSKDAYFTLPSLKVVHINLAERIDKRDAGSKNIESIESDFQSAGVHVHWTTTSA